MPRLTDVELFKRIKTNQLEKIYFLYGAEKYFVRKAVDMLKSAIVPSGTESFNLTELDGEKLDVSALEDICEGMPMMAQRKCVAVKDINIDKLNPNQLESLMNLIADVNPTTILIFYLVSPAIEVKKTAKFKKLFAAIEKEGVICEFELKDKATLKRALMEKASKNLVELDGRAADALVERCSQSYGVLLNEMDKLISYALAKNDIQKEITIKDIEECTVASIDASAFDLAKAVLAGNFNRAFILIDELFYLRQEAVPIISAAAMAFGDIYRAKAAALRGLTPEQVAKDFNYPQSRVFAIKNAFRDIRRYSIEDIRFCINSLYKADSELKSSKLDDRLILERAVGEMLLRSREAAK